jgi:hypothetical protein
MGNEGMPSVGSRRLVLYCKGRHPRAAVGLGTKEGKNSTSRKRSAWTHVSRMGGRESGRESGYLVDPASSHMLVSKIKPCMSKYKQVCTVKLRMAH